MGELTTRESPWWPLDLALAQVTIGWGAEASSLPQAAVDAMVLGADGVHLAVLAGMDDANWSELEQQLARIYPAERGAPRAEGRAAAELVARWLVEEAASEDMNGLRAIHEVYALYVALDYPDGDLGALATFEDTLDLIDAGVVGATRASVVTDFVAACQRILAAGGPTIPDS